MGVFDNVTPEFSDAAAGFTGDLKDTATDTDWNDFEPGEQESFAADPADVPPTRDHTNIIDGPPIATPDDVKSSRATKLERELSQMYSMIGVGVFAFDQQIGGVIIGQADACAASLNDLAKVNPGVRRALEGMLATSAWGGVIAAHLPIVTMVATKYVPAVRARYVAATTPDVPTEQYPA